MKNQAYVLFSKINTTHIQVALMIIALAMLVLGAGAVDDFGHVGRR